MTADRFPRLPTNLLAAAVGAVPGGIDAARASSRWPTRSPTPSTRGGAPAGAGRHRHRQVPGLPGAVAAGRRARWWSPPPPWRCSHQLVDHDLPRLADAVEPLLGRRPTFAVLKGRHHYLCLARLEGTSRSRSRTSALRRRRQAGRDPLARRGRPARQADRSGSANGPTETETGDRDELDPGVDDAAWRLVSMPARECVGAARCPFGEECFAEASRARAREADIVVTNHSLLAVDMLAGRHIIPPHKLLVIDEAHELADRVSSARAGRAHPGGDRPGRPPGPPLVDAGAARAR